MELKLIGEGGSTNGVYSSNCTFMELKSNEMVESNVVILF